MKHSIRTITISLLSLMLWSNSAKAQQIFQTREGSVGVIGEFRDSQIVANSHHLFALINYETADIVLTLDPTTLVTSVDSLNTKLLGATIGLITLKGKLNMPYINTLKHPDHKINFEAEINMNGVVRSTYVTGDLMHIASNGTISCLLTLDIKLALSDFEISPPEGWDDTILIQISQAILKKSNQ